MDETSTHTPIRGLAQFRRKYPFDVSEFAEGKWRVHDAGSGETVAEVLLVATDSGPAVGGRVRVIADALAGAVPLDDATIGYPPKRVKLSHRARFVLASGLHQSSPKHVGLHGPTVWIAAYKAWR